MKNTLRIVLWIFCFLLTACSSCNKKQPYRIPKYDNPSYKQPFEEESQVEGDTAAYEDYDYITVSSEYSPSSIYVPEGTSLQEALYNIAPQMEYGWQKPYIGGAKLIAEMSADAAGINQSRFGQDCYINILPLHLLKLRICDDPFSLYALVCTNTISIDMCKIESNGFFSDHFTVTIKVTNKTGYDVVVNIPQGQMIEAEKDNVQNVVVTEGKQIVLQPYENKTFRVTASCAAHHRSSPSGSKGRITPYVLTAPQSTYHTQQSIWDYIEEPATQRLVFYAWGRGPLENGHNSSTGHAFVFIPEIGYVGYGSAHGDWVDDEGVISNHTRQAQLAQDSCVVWITNLQLNSVYDKVNQLLSNTPRYHIGNYDCTSFVMDIADAAGIYYGYRMPWRTPMGFIKELKKRN